MSVENALLLLPALRRARDLIDRDYAEPLDLDIDGSRGRLLAISLRPGVHRGLR